MQLTPFDFHCENAAHLVREIMALQFKIIFLSALFPQESPEVIEAFIEWRKKKAKLIQSTEALTKLLNRTDQNEDNAPEIARSYIGNLLTCYGASFAKEESSSPDSSSGKLLGLIHTKDRAYHDGQCLFHRLYEPSPFVPLSSEQRYALLVSPSGGAKSCISAGEQSQA